MDAKRSVRYAQFAALQINAGLLFLATGAAAQVPPPPDHFTYSIWAGLEHTDNLERSREGGSADLMFVPGLNYSVLHSGRRWRVRGDGELRMERSGPEAGADPRARGSLSVDWAVVPQRLYWSFQDFAQVQSVDPLAPDDPSNREQTNLFQTGPVLLLGNPHDFLGRIEAQAAVAQAELSPDFDHNRMLLSAWLARQTDPIQSFSTGLESTAVDYRQGGRARDFLRLDMLLRYRRETPRSTLALTLGYSSIDLEIGERISRPLAHFDLRLAPTSSQELSLSLRHELSDAGRELGQFLNPLDPFRTEARRTVTGSELFRLDAAELYWTWRGARSEVRAGGFIRDHDNQDPGTRALKRSQGAQFGLTRLVTPNSRLGFNIAGEDFAFENTARHDRDTYLGISYERDLNPRWKLRMGLTRQRRSSSELLVGFVENIASIYLVYSGRR